MASKSCEGLTFSRSLMVKPSLLTLPTRSTSSAFVALIRLRAIGVGNVFSSSVKNLWVWNGGFVWDDVEGCACFAEIIWVDGWGGLKYSFENDSFEPGGSEPDWVVFVRPLSEVASDMDREVEGSSEWGGSGSETFGEA